MEAIRLRPYQEEAIAAVLATRSAGTLRQLIVLATGLGKTVLAAALARRLACRTLFLVHRDELAQQAMAKFGLVWPECSRGLVKAQTEELGRAVTVASIQTVGRDARLARLVAAGPYDLVIVDEAHHAAAPSWRRVLDAVVGPQTLLVGLTATPNRADGLALADVFSVIPYRMGILEGIRQGYLADVEGLRMDVGANLDQVQVRAGDFAEGALSQVMAEPAVIAATVGAWHENVSRRTLAFTVTVDHAQKLAAAFRAAGVTASYVSGDTPLEERRAELRRFERGQTQVVCNCAVLTEGFDDPGIEAVLLARPTLSESLYIQMVGRGLRPYPGKERCLVLDCAGNSTQHSLVQLGMLAGLQPDAETIREVTGKKQLDGDVVKPETPKHVQSLLAFADGKVQSTNLYTEAFAARKYDWVRTAYGHALDLGDAPGFLLIREDREQPGLHRVVHVFCDEWRARFEVLTPDPLTFDWAMGLAEGAAQRFLGGAQKARWQQRQSDWRLAPPSEAQVRVLRRAGIDPPRTRGEAAAALTRHIVERDVAGFRRSDDGQRVRAHLRHILHQGAMPSHLGLASDDDIEALTDGDARRLRAQLYRAQKESGNASNSAAA